VLRERARGGAAAEGLWLRVNRQCLVEGDPKDLGLGVERAAVRALLEIRAVTTVLRGDFLTGLRVGAEDAGQREELKRGVELDRLDRHVAEEGGRARLHDLGLLLALRLLALDDRHLWRRG